MKNDKTALPRHAATLRIQLMSLVRRLRREAELEDVPFSQMSLLGAVDRLGEAATPTALAEAEGLRSSNLAALLRRLEEDGLVMRRSDASDKRKTRVSLTELGSTMLNGHRTRRERWLADMIQHHLSDHEQSILFEAGRLMERLAGLSESHPPERQTP
jgi:DNA-binding MarR family transcriptional regulator